MTITSQTAIQYIKGVGPHRAELFQNLGITLAGDLLEYFPRGYDFQPDLMRTGELYVNCTATIIGEVITIDVNRRSKPPRVDITVEDADGKFQLSWFNAGYIKDKLIPGDIISAWGKVNSYRNKLQMTNPAWLKVENIDEYLSNYGSVQCRYPATAELASNEISRTIRRCLPDLLNQVEEYYPANYRQDRKLPTRKEALQWIHQPEDQEQADQARRSLVYDELLQMQLAVAMRKARNKYSLPACALPSSDEIDRRIRRLLPFTLTGAQDRVINEIVADLATSEPMNRLLQGDVGSGKTVVALYALLLTIANRKQAAIMAPTEILAVQHYNEIQKYLTDSQVKITLLKGGTSGTARKQLLDEISNGQIDIVVGTQALLQQDVNFNELGLVIIDEQHKFGVKQREAFRSKATAPHYLVMTATPIPRTLAMTVFGDLDVSIIDELPPGRKPVETRWVRNDRLPEAYSGLRRLVKQGRQAYFVYPRIEQEEIDTEDPWLNPAQQLKAAVDEHRHLQQDIFPELNVGLLHGQMPAEEKKQVMADFVSGKINILVSTVVIEVGVNVPNATVMIIEHADRYGLAQLHQLRGRIGRGAQQSYCLLFGNPRSEEGRARLEIMTRTNDGFKIAEEDLKLRGPGEFFGTSQHGMPGMKIADLTRDFDLLNMARRDAQSLIKDDPHLTNPDFSALKRDMLQRYSQCLGLIDIS
ncbi:MAG: ATP-dependent DNA helicase RecG [Sedimentisphaerales bacterium]|nr:ATP-dependent DNA helicase RecG [Sedimentisphaerales bacterium]MBN2844074.1 ATP-dependent DNA helicase RecG [Sedimentisphaerales bacterium]